MNDQVVRHLYNREAAAAGLKAEKIMVEHLRSRDGIYYVVHYPYGSMGVDISYIVAGDHHRFVHADVELRWWWSKDDNCYSHASVHIPKRKERMIRRYAPEFRYFVMRSDYLSFLVINGDDILRSPDWVNRHGEDFFDVDLSDTNGYGWIEERVDG